METNFEKILKRGGAVVLASIAFLPGIPFQQENISPICTEPIPNNIDLSDNFTDCNKITIQLSHDFGVSASGPNISGAVALTPNFMKNLKNPLALYLT